MRTLEERERLAYIEGRVEEAALLAEVIDADPLSCADCDCDEADE